MNDLFAENRPISQSHLVPVATIAIAQLFGTSLWFSANAAADDLRKAWGVGPADIGILTNAVQLGFIVSTLLFALTGLADQYRPSRIFAVCALLGAAANAGFAWFSTGVTSAAFFRLLVGVCLAGVYPIGMKLVVTWAPDRTGSALGYLVGMLTLGTALPHLLRAIGASWKWQYVILSSSALALLAALLIVVLGDGPHLVLRRTGGHLHGVLGAFRSPDFRAAALGYFGHMWEVYAFWTIVPLLIVRTSLNLKLHGANPSGLAFAIIAMGFVGCTTGGILSHSWGSGRVAATALVLSALCCLIFAAAWQTLPAVLLLALFVIWGASVAADSPQFSALSAKACPQDLIGGALAIQISIGFAITIVSIAVVTGLFERWGVSVAWILLPGPILGLIGFWPEWGK